MSTAMGSTALCPNCGLDTHVRCCSWCGQKHKPKRYQNDHCSAKCEKEAARWDKGSAALQEAYDAEDPEET